MLRYALIRADGSKKIGLGHLTRQIDIANSLRKLNYEVFFLSKNYPKGISLIERSKFKILKLRSKQQTITESIKEIKSILDSFNREFHLIMVDLVKNFDNQDYLNTFKGYCNKLYVLSDDPHKFNIDVNGVFAISPNQELFDYNRSKSKYYTGLKYFPLHKIYQNVQKKNIREQVSKILLTFGGSDPNNYSSKIIKILKELNINVQISLILGSAFSEETYKSLIQEKSENIVIKKNVPNVNMIDFFLEADLSICSAGNTVIELLTCGVPCIIIPQTKLENRRAEALERKNMGVNMGLNFNDSLFIKKIKSLLTNSSQRRIFSEKAQETLDGRGINRIVEILAEAKQ
ncbi:MAG: PseG/SpsG family protein [Candidatus Hermodarchaeota archaeon]